MGVSVERVVGVIEAHAPRALAENWDNVGLLVGAESTMVSRVLLTLDVTDEVVDAAIALGCELIIAHHPVIFRPLKALRTDSPQGRILAKLLRAGLSVYAAHTNWDKSHAGTSTRLAELLMLKNISVLKVMEGESVYKLVTYVPYTHSTAVFLALSTAGAGHIGNYSHCSFQVHGQGTFMPLFGSRPQLGGEGELAQVDEVRLEMMVSEQKLTRVLASLKQAHPYEEVAYSVLKLHNGGQGYGLGCIGDRTPPTEWQGFGDQVRNLFPAARVAGSLPQVVRRVAVCGGAGAELVSLAHARGAQVLVTGDVGHHYALEAESLGMAVIDAGHYATEAPLLGDWRALLESFANSNQISLDVAIFTPTNALFSPL